MLQLEINLIYEWVCMLWLPAAEEMDLVAQVYAA